MNQQMPCGGDLFVTRSPIGNTCRSCTRLAPEVWGFMHHRDWSNRLERGEIPSENDRRARWDVDDSFGKCLGPFAARFLEVS
jgi:hypothetical protein